MWLKITASLHMTQNNFQKGHKVFNFSEIPDLDTFGNTLPSQSYEKPLNSETDVC
jgi:hypothetical protein